MALKFKWVWVCVLISALVIGIAACGGDEESSGTQTSAPPKGTVSKDAFLKRVSQLNADLKTCELEMDMKMAMKGWDG